jgi:hypothetical protein
LQICKNLGFYLQKRAVKSNGTDLIRRIEIQRTRSNAAAGERLTGIDPGSIRSGPQDVHRMAQGLRKQLAAARGRRRRGSRRRRTVNGGATGETAAGCTTRRGEFTRRTASALRTPRQAPGGAAARRRVAQRATAAAGVPRRQSGEMAHEGVNE